MKGSLRYFMTEGTGDNILEVEPNLEGGMTVHQGLGKTYTLCCKLYNEKTKAVQTTIDSFIFLRRKHFSSQCV